MAITFTRQVVTTGTGTTSIINSNFEAIQNALADAVSRAGTSANAMNANLDMNSKRIINLPAATTNTEPVNYGQFLAAQGDLLYSGELDGSNVIFTPSGSGAVETNVQAQLVLGACLPQHFGAVGDGTTDDTAAFTACIAAAIAGKGRIYIPKGTYKITSQLQITIGSGIANRGLVIEGAARHEVTLVYYGSDYCFRLGTGQVNSPDAWAIQFRHLSIKGGNSTPTGGVHFNGAYFCSMYDCTVKEFTNASGRGVFFAGTGDIPNYHCVIDHCQFRDVPVGIYGESAGSGIGMNSNFIQHSWFGGHSTNAIRIDGGDTNVITMNEFNGGTTTAIYLENDSNDTKIIANQFDGPTVWVNISSAACNNTLLQFNTGGGNGGQFALEYLNSGTNTMLLSSVLGRITVSSGLGIGGPGTATNAVPLTVIAPAGLSTDSFRVNNSSGTALFSVNQGGAITAVTGTLTGAFTQTNTNGNSILHTIDATSTPATNLAKWKQASGQTANVLEVQNTSGTIEFRIGPKGFLEFLEQTDPTAPSSNRAILYSKDNGSGKTQLCVRFPTGAVQVLATEP